MGRNMTQTIFLVDPVASVHFMSQRLEEAGFRTVALFSGTLDMPQEEIFSRFNKDWCHEMLQLSGDITVDIATLEELYALEDVASIISGNDDTLPYTEQLRQHITPQHANDPSLTACRQEKYAMNACLHALNIPAAKQWLLPVDEIPTTNHLDYHYPLIVKPNHLGGASYGVAKVESAEELQQHLAEFTGKGSPFYGGSVTEYCLQEFLEGPEWVIDTVSYKGQHYVAGILRYAKDYINGIPVYRYTETIDQHDKKARIVIEYIKQVLDAMSVSFGFHHSEVIFTKEGPRLVEVNPRISGAYSALARASEVSFGYSQPSLLAQLLKNDSFEYQPASFKPARSVFLFSLKDYLIHDIDMRYLKSKHVELVYLRKNELPEVNYKFENLAAVINLSDADSGVIEEDIKILFSRERACSLFNKLGEVL